MDRYYLTFFSNISRDFSLQYNSMASIVTVELLSQKVNYKQNRNIEDYAYNMFIDHFRDEIIFSSCINDICV